MVFYLDVKFSFPDKIVGEKSLYTKIGFKTK